MKPAKPRPFPWDEAMAFGLGILRLTPRHFWSMTPRELQAAVRARGGGPGPRLERAALADLMRIFPDADARPMT